MRRWIRRAEARRQGGSRGPTLLLRLFWLIPAAPIAGQTTKYQPGDNPAWSDPAFDDSAWKSLKAEEDIEIPITAGGFVWVRGRFVAPSAAEPLSVCATGYIAQVWVNGRLLTERGKFPPHWEARAADAYGPLCTPIPPGWIAPGQAVLLAKRVWYQQAALSATRTADVGNIELKNSELAKAERGRDRALGRAQTVFDLGQGVIQLLFGIFLILFWRRTRSEVDILLFGQLLIVWALFPVVQASRWLPIVSASAYRVANLTVSLWFGQAIALFACEVLGLRRWRIAICLAFLLGSLALFPLAVAAERSWLVEIVNLGPPLEAILLLALTGIGCRRIWRERFSQAITISLTLLFASGWLPYAGMPFSIHIIGFRMIVDRIFFWIFAVCMSWFLLIRAWGAWKAERARDTEFRAAREVQASLLKVADAPGFRIDAAYVPASEVGGDFYQFLPADDGSLLVVVGDVSGKGLEAAMLVAVMVGALGDLASRSPAQVLGHLNQVVMGKTRGGFVTCGAALFRSGGTVQIANAGHIPPYMEGRELELVPGPPLGIIADVLYESTTLSSGAGAITFFSDGVVEATNGSGELLGFDRLAGLSVKPAREIAKEAELWGQEDDITVVQVAYA